MNFKESLFNDPDRYRRDAFALCVLASAQLANRLVNSAKWSVKESARYLKMSNGVAVNKSALN